MSESQGKLIGLKIAIFGLHFTLLGFAIEPGFPLFAVGITISAIGLLIE